MTTDIKMCDDRRNGDEQKGKRDLFCIYQTIS